MSKHSLFSTKFVRGSWSVSNNAVFVLPQFGYDGSRDERPEAADVFRVW